MGESLEVPTDRLCENAANHRTEELFYFINKNTLFSSDTLAGTQPGLVYDPGAKDLKTEGWLRIHTPAPMGLSMLCVLWGWA